MLWFVMSAAALALVYRIGGVKRLHELPPTPHLVALLALIALHLPAARLAARVTGRRSGRLSSVQGRVRWRWLATCLVIAVAVAAPQLVVIVVWAGTHSGLAGWPSLLPQLALVLLLVPLQAAGEEYFYRGTLMQCVGSFTRSRWPPAIVSVAAFTAMHRLRPEIVMSIGAFAASTAWLTLRTGGLEAALATHITTNVAAMGLSAATTGLRPEINQHMHWLAVAVSLATTAIYAVAIARLARRVPDLCDAARA